MQKSKSNELLKIQEQVIELSSRLARLSLELNKIIKEERSDNSQDTEDSPAPTSLAEIWLPLKLPKPLSSTQNIKVDKKKGYKRSSFGKPTRDGKNNQTISDPSAEFSIQRG